MEAFQQQMTFMHVTHIESFSSDWSICLFDYKTIVAGKNQGGTAEYFVPCMFRHTRDFLFVTSVELLTGNETFKILIIKEEGAEDERKFRTD